MTSDRPPGRGRSPVRIPVIPREARAYQGQAAGIVSRGLAGAIDIVVVFAMMGVFYLGWATLLFVIDPVAFRPPAVSRTMVIIVGGVLLVAYLAVGWATVGRTFGDHVLGLRVIDRRGRVPHPALALLRSVLCTVFMVGVLWAAVSPRRRSVQDILVRTSVIYDWDHFTRGE
ncbi:RDD family protein [Amycolatopsis panacis]|uniref:RDD family protein n=1 Tax=Amycolatopsis panacis TaxID=2340917 RepID=A0A419IBH3_9PSEU|nr:RDD family protein [Amycolatopsis panacis]RJQ92300.1 RDD family protein [Amycolatopsis panacis]